MVFDDQLNTRKREGKLTKEREIEEKTAKEKENKGRENKRKENKPKEQKPKAGLKERRKLN